MKINMWLLLLISLLLSGCSDNQKYNLGKPYQKNFNAAWQEAGQGQSPVNTCLSVGVTAISMVSAGQDKNNEAQQAFEACFVDAFVRYANVSFSHLDNTQADSIAFIKACSGFRSNLRANSIVMGGEYAKKFDADIEVLNNKIRAGLVETATLCSGYAHYFD